MAQAKPPEDQMNYETLAQDALRGVVKAALKVAAAPGGIPGDHHFYITFRTKAPGVSGPPEVLSKYPEEMTIVLQHQYWDLAPGETFFTVTLKFGGSPKRLSVPYSALTRFFDPYVQFGLQFEPPVADVVADEDAAEGADSGDGDEPGPPKDDGPKVVSLDQFRKK
ncbi:MAG: stringent starvation protein B [Caulobacter sp.]|jgi:hypothetical protein|nr:stringent starvation protein B [Caulobacter sp.]